MSCCADTDCCARVALRAVQRLAIKERHKTLMLIRSIVSFEWDLTNSSLLACAIKHWNPWTDAWTYTKQSRLNAHLGSPLSPFQRLQGFIFFFLSFFHSVVWDDYRDATTPIHNPVKSIVHRGIAPRTQLAIAHKIWQGNTKCTVITKLFKSSCCCFPSTYGLQSQYNTLHLENLVAMCKQWND